ncbi:LacI family DNA-binding transcriptional regulator [Thioclava sp. GXIMD4216]|uniref:LacI family DNA-binding transcriptional regulator n=1 Tax=Thioclava litoralis TaxID=3076557 RepID=A0ABZ1DX79_9RHOB|nr:LacI family DNA-binding transcriptional regulator [Thioclava sp. FTW29]
MTLKDLARQLGLSPTTVSRALNGFPEVAEATRLRVCEAARESGYHPNMQARRLATGRAMAIGHILPMAPEHDLVNPVFADFIAGAGEIYALRGYDLVMTLVPAQDEEAAYRAMAAKHNVDGVILHGARQNDPRPALLRSLGLPFVTHGRPPASSETDLWVDAHHEAAFEQLTALLLDQGHRQIAFINSPDPLQSSAYRRTGFERAFLARGLEVPRLYMVAGEVSDETGRDAAAEMLSWEQRPSAFVTASLMAAMGVRRAVEDTGHVLGRDISVVTWDDELSFVSNRGLNPLYTTMKSPIREAGQRAAQMLIDRIETPEIAQSPLLIEPALLMGHSIGAWNG